MEDKAAPINSKVSLWAVGITACLVLILGLVWTGVIISLTVGKGQPSIPALLEQTTTSAEDIKVTKLNSKYQVATSKPSGSFTTGQEADIMLSGIGFNKSGGPLLFNHPGNIASDGTHFLLADRNNNRILIWNKLPSGNTPPDLVLGQKDFTTNNAGTALNELNWPIAVAVANGKVVVGDTNNDRVLIWNHFPTQNNQSADIEFKAGWPWAVWTNGEKLIVTATAGANVLIWNSFPTQNNQKPDIILTGNRQFGTPRSIASNGKYLMIGDHNAKPNDNHAGNFFWQNFPTADVPYDFFVADVFKMGEMRPQNVQQGGDVLWGGMTGDGKLIGLANMLYIWNSFPENKKDEADLKIGGFPGQGGYDFGGSQSGDGSAALLAGGKLYLSLYNGNKVVGFNALPATQDQKPDFVIGAPDINTNTLETSYMLTNPTIATDGKSLFAGANLY